MKRISKSSSETCINCGSNRKLKFIGWHLIQWWGDFSAQLSYLVQWKQYLKSQKGKETLQKLTYGLTCLNKKMYGLFFFKETSITGIIYLDIITKFFKPQLLDDSILDNVVFRQDESPCHFIIRVYLNRRFPNR